MRNITFIGCKVPLLPKTLASLLSVRLLASAKSPREMCTGTGDICNRWLFKRNGWSGICLAASARCLPRSDGKFSSQL